MLAFLAILFAFLGIWQTNRSAEKFDLEHRFSTAAIMPLSDALEQEHRFARVTARGKFDQQRHLLLDNQMYRGQPGVHVYTPFYTQDHATLLVNRGWLPMSSDRKTLPAIQTPDKEVSVTGRLNTFPVPGRILGNADNLQNNQWPQLVTYLQPMDIAEAIGTDMLPWVIQLAPEDVSGFEDRNWKPVYLSSQKHSAYAFQWYAMVLITIVLWVAGGIRRAKGKNS